MNFSSFFLPSEFQTEEFRTMNLHQAGGLEKVLEWLRRTLEIILAAFSLHRHCKSSSVIFQSSKHSHLEGSNSSNCVDTKNKSFFFPKKSSTPWNICLLCQKEAAETGTDEKHQIKIDFWSRIVAFCINQCLTWFLYTDLSKNAIYSIFKTNIPNLYTKNQPE